jgi:hypothetical protein
MPIKAKHKIQESKAEVTQATPDDIQVMLTGAKLAEQVQVRPMEVGPVTTDQKAWIIEYCSRHGKRNNSEDLARAYSKHFQDHQREGKQLLYTWYNFKSKIKK